MILLQNPDAVSEKSAKMGFSANFRVTKLHVKWTFSIADEPTVRCVAKFRESLSRDDGERYLEKIDNNLKFNGSSLLHRGQHALLQYCKHTKKDTNQ